MKSFSYQRATCLSAVLFVCGLSLVTALSGCSANASGHAAHTPSADVASTALETALNASKYGRPHGTIEAKPLVNVVDSAWLNGQKISDFNIQEEQGGGDTRNFLVKLKQTSPDREQQVRYIVHGLDPVWVYRE